MSSGQKPRDPLHFPKMKVRGGRRRLRKELSYFLGTPLDTEAIRSSLMVMVEAFQEVAASMTRTEFHRAFLVPGIEDYKPTLPVIPLDVVRTAQPNTINVDFTSTRQEGTDESSEARSSE